MAVFCAADVVYAVRVNAGIYVAGPWLYLLWMTGVTCIAASFWSPRRSRGIPAAPLEDDARDPHAARPSPPSGFSRSSR